MRDQRLVLALIGLLAFLCAIGVESGKQSGSLSDLEDDEEVTVVPSVVSSSKRKKPSSYSSYGYGNSNYYDYTPSQAYTPTQVPYYSRYGSADSLSMPSYTRHQRYVHPDYLGENMQIAQAPYTISDSSAEPFPSASHHSYGHSTGSSHGSGHGSGHGHGHTKTHTNYKISAVNTDAIGLLGLLGLLSILQAVAMSLTTTTTTTTAATARRRKRDVEEEETAVEKVAELGMDEISKLLLPSLNLVA